MRTCGAPRSASENTATVRRPSGPCGAHQSHGDLAPVGDEHRVADRSHFASRTARGADAFLSTDSFRPCRPAGGCRGVTDPSKPVNNARRACLSCDRYSIGRPLDRVMRDLRRPIGRRRVPCAHADVPAAQPTSSTRPGPPTSTGSTDEVARGRLILTGRLESADRRRARSPATSAPRTPRTLMANDPYHLAGLVRYERVGFTGGVRAPGL